ncbi:glycosyltransferase [Paeniglutamicibacter antarcticus]|uniref:D-inositol 3-phosphate glycosyltransferase n=1 Tax=Paeniglutamicibacter antarcticus TaxID=494023 RepID=A0ABP9TSB8_9MICC
MTEPTILPKRIAMISLHTSPLEQPGSGDAGGMNVYVRHLALALGELGIEVDVFVRGETQSSATAMAPGVVCHEVPAGPAGKLSKEDLAEHLEDAARAIRDYATGFAPYEVIHSHYWLSGVVGLRLAKVWDVPLVHTMHTMGKVKKLSAQTEESAARIRAEMLLCREADRLMANTPAEVQELVDLYGAQPQIVDVVEPGVDLSCFHPGVCVQRESPDGSLRVVFAGRLQKLKGPQILVRALGILARERPDLDVKLSVIGARSGAKELNLQKLVEAEGVEHLVRFSLPMPAEHLAKAFRCADVVAVPSYSESFGLVALEAQACGTPVLAHRVGGLPHAVQDGRTGILVDGAEPASWAAALATLATNPALRLSLGTQAAVFAAGHGWEQTADAAIMSYQRALDCCAVLASGSTPAH